MSEIGASGAGARMFERFEVVVELVEGDLQHAGKSGALPRLGLGFTTLPPPDRAAIQARILGQLFLRLAESLAAVDEPDPVRQCRTFLGCNWLGCGLTMIAAGQDAAASSLRHGVHIDALECAPDLGHATNWLPAGRNPQPPAMAWHCGYRLLSKTTSPAGETEQVAVSTRIDPTGGGSSAAADEQRSGFGWVRSSGADGPLVGAVVTVDAPEVAEALAGCGLGWLLVDMQHAPTLGARQVQRVLQAVGRRCRTVVRVPANDRAWIGMALDAGCDGVLIPHVTGPDDAARAVRAAKYPPVGCRSIGTSRAHGYGTRFGEYLRNANDTTAVIVHIGDETAADSIDAIIAVSDVAAVFIGPDDLAGSMGWPGMIGHPPVVALIDQVRNHCRSAGVPVGVLATDPTAAAEQIERGVDLIAIGTDLSLLTSAVRDGLPHLRGGHAAG